MEQVYEKQRLEAPEMAKKNSAQSAKQRQLTIILLNIWETYLG